MLKGGKRAPDVAWVAQRVPSGLNVGLEGLKIEVGDHSLENGLGQSVQLLVLPFSLLVLPLRGDLHAGRDIEAVRHRWRGRNRGGARGRKAGGGRSVAGGKLLAKLNRIGLQSDLLLGLALALAVAVILLLVELVTDLLVLSG